MRRVPQDRARANPSSEQYCVFNRGNVAVVTAARRLAQARGTAHVAVRDGGFGGITYFDGATARPPLSEATLDEIGRAFERAAPIERDTGEPLVCMASNGALYAWVRSTEAEHDLARRVVAIIARDRGAARAAG